MALLPEGSVFQLAACSIVVTDISFTTTSEYFDRSEFSYERLRSSKYSNGSSPQFVPTLGGGVGQVIIGCNPVPPMYVVPDDNVIASVKQKLFIRRYTIRTDLNPDATMTYLASVASTHKTYLDRFAAHQAEAGSPISFQALLGLQSETFSYLTSTGIALSGPTLGTVSNVLIRDYQMIDEREIPYPALILRSAQMTVDQITIQSAFA